MLTKAWWRSRQKIFPSFFQVSSNEPHLRCSKNNIPKARMKTLKMSIVIVISFIVCWTPYYLLGLWYWFFPDDLEGKVSHSLTHILFIFGLFNTCLDPVIYGLFTIPFQRGLRRCYRKATVTSGRDTNAVTAESLRCASAALPSEGAMAVGGRDKNCGQAELKPTDSSIWLLSHWKGQKFFQHRKRIIIHCSKTSFRINFTAVLSGHSSFPNTPNVHV